MLKRITDWVVFLTFIILGISVLALMWVEIFR